MEPDLHMPQSPRLRNREAAPGQRSDEIRTQAAVAAIQET